MESNPIALQRLTNLIAAYEFLPNIDLFKLIGQQFCRDTAPTIVLCESILFLITGFNEKNLNAVSKQHYLPSKTQ